MARYGCDNFCSSFTEGYGRFESSVPHLHNQHFWLILSETSCLLLALKASPICHFWLPRIVWEWLRGSPRLRAQFAVTCPELFWTGKWGEPGTVSSRPSRKVVVRKGCFPVCVCVCPRVNAAVVEISFSGDEKRLHWWSKSREVLGLSLGKKHFGHFCVVCHCCATTCYRGGRESGDVFSFVMPTSGLDPPSPFRLRLRILLHILILALTTLQEKKCFYLRRWPDFCVVFRGSSCFSFCSWTDRADTEIGLGGAVHPNMFQLQVKCFDVGALYFPLALGSHVKVKYFTCLWKFVVPWALYLGPCLCAKGNSYNGLKSTRSTGIH